MYQCPKCGSNKTYKDRKSGADTGDRKCSECSYVGEAREFKK